MRKRVKEKKFIQKNNQLNEDQNQLRHKKTTRNKTGITATI